jgi:hypothetical protein
MKKPSRAELLKNNDLTERETEREREREKERVTVDELTRSTCSAILSQHPCNFNSMLDICGICTELLRSALA